MSDRQNVNDEPEKDTHGYIIRACGLCAKKLGKSWSRHWDRQHPGNEPFELAKDAQPDQCKETFNNGKFKRGFDARRGKRSKGPKDDARSEKPQPLDQLSLLDNARPRRDLKNDEQQEVPQVQLYDDDLGFMSDENEGLVVASTLSSRIKIISQEMTDMEAIELLETIATTDSDDCLHRMKLIDISHLYTQQAIAQRLKFSGSARLRKLFSECEPISGMTNRQVAGLAVGMIAIGGQAIESIPGLFAKLDIEQAELVAPMIRYGLKSVYMDDSMCSWLVDCRMYLRESLQRVIEYLDRVPQEHTLSILQAQRVCHLPESLPNFCTMVGVLARSAQSDIVDDSLKSIPNQEKMFFDDFVPLVELLSQEKNQARVNEFKDDLMRIEMREWLAFLRAELAKQEAPQDLNRDAMSYLDDLQRLYGGITGSFIKHAVGQQSGHVQTIFNQTDRRPNQYQLSLAAYMIGSIGKKPKQSWTIAAGAGKSRIIASAALLALLLTDFETVHIVTSHQTLAKRDEEEFRSYFELTTVGQRVRYHWHTQFSVSSRDIVLVDEADFLMTSAPEAFFSAFSSTSIICFSGSSDDVGLKEFEKTIFQSMDYKCFSYWPSNLPQSPRISIDRRVKAVSLDALAELVQQELLARPVLLFCSSWAQMFFEEKFEDVLALHEDSDFEALRSLDVRAQGPSYKLILTSLPWTMRGHDYRAPSKGITLIVAQSFNSTREKIQGLSRVGRFGDDCTRLLLDDVPLVDATKERELHKVLLAFRNAQRGSKFMLQVASKPSSTGTRRKIKAASKAKQLKQTQLSIFSKDASQPKQ